MGAGSQGGPGGGQNKKNTYISTEGFKHGIWAEEGRPKCTFKSNLYKLFKMGKVGLMVDGRLEARDRSPGASSWVAASSPPSPPATPQLSEERAIELFDYLRMCGCKDILWAGQSMSAMVGAPSFFLLMVPTNTCTLLHQASCPLTHTGKVTLDDCHRSLIM